MSRHTQFSPRFRIGHGKRKQPTARSAGTHHQLTVSVRGQPAVEGMEATVARGIAYAAHRYSRTRYGELVIDHVARVAGAVPPEAKATAWLHHVLETTPSTVVELREQGL